MAFCPHCGQPYPQGQEYCQNCGTVLRVVSSARDQPNSPSMSGAPQQPPLVRPKTKPSNLRKGLLLVVVVIVIAIIAIETSGLLSVHLGGSKNSLQTWQQFGMSVQYPAGVNTQYSGVLDQQADTASGEAEWLWNGANTGFLVTWITTTSFNANAGLQGIYNKLIATASSVQLTDEGTVAMAGHYWQYQTYAFTMNGESGYATFAVAYYSTSGRAYALGFVDTSDTTLGSLLSYGNTFTG